MPWNLLATSFMGGSHCFWLSKRGHQKKMLVVKVAENGSGLSLGGFPGIEVGRTKEAPTNPPCQAGFILALIKLGYLKEPLTSCRLPIIYMVAKGQ